MIPAVAVPGDTASASYDDDYYLTSYGYEPVEYTYYYGKNDNRKSYGKTDSFMRKLGKSDSDQASSSYSYFGWYPYSGGGQYGSRSGGQYGSPSDSYGGYDGYGGGGHKCCCNNNNNLATLGALALGFLALNGQLQNLINAINGNGRRRKRDTDNDETANGKMTARFSFAKSLVTVRKKITLAFQPSSKLLTQIC